MGHPADPTYPDTTNEWGTRWKGREFSRAEEGHQFCLRALADRTVMFSEDDSTRLMVILGVIGTLLGVVVRIVSHSTIAVLLGAVGGLLVAFLLAAVRGEQV